MPTGLTSDIYEGKDMSLRKFALKCATHFTGGYQASEGGSKPLPLYEPPVIPLNSYYVENLEKAKEELKYWLEVKNNTELSRKLYDDYVMKHEAAKADYNQKINVEMRGRYLKMLGKVEAWEVDMEYQNIKDFMLGQIKESMEHDCPENVENPYDYELPSSIEDWLKLNIEESESDIEYYTEKMEKEIKNNKELNDYLKGFYEQINKAEPKE